MASVSFGSLMTILRLLRLKGMVLTNCNLSMTIDCVSSIYNSCSSSQLPNCRSKAFQRFSVARCQNSPELQKQADNPIIKRCTAETHLYNDPDISSPFAFCRRESIDNTLPLMPICIAYGHLQIIITHNINAIWILQFEVTSSAV